jgi:SAM-dependent methyltransferase
MYGRLIMATTWHEDERFWRDLMTVIFSTRRRAEAPEEVAKLIALLELPEDGGGVQVLDLPCGVGRHSIELAARGFSVTGVDRTPEYLDEARGQASERGVTVELERGDMRAWQRENAFDLLLNMFTSFGYFDDPADELRTARNFHASLRPGGRLVMEMMGKEIIASKFTERDWSELDDGSLLLEQREIVDAWRRIRTRWIVFRDGQRLEHELNLRCYSAGDLIRILEAAGFGELKVYGDLEGAPYDHHAKRLVVVATKP